MELFRSARKEGKPAKAELVEHENTFIDHSRIILSIKQIKGVFV